MLPLRLVANIGAVRVVACVCACMYLCTYVCACVVYVCVCVWCVYACVSVYVTVNYTAPIQYRITVCASHGSQSDLFENSAFLPVKPTFCGGTLLQALRQFFTKPGEQAA